MPFRAPLTYAELRAIRLRHTRPDGTVEPDILALLHEARQKRAFVLRFHQLESELKRPVGVMGDVYDILIEAKNLEPCVHERDQTTAELLNVPGKLRKGMAPR